MKILGIETSCDETALSIIEVSDGENPEFKVLGNVLISQTKIHEQYGGVFPMVAKREHGKNLVPLLLKVLGESDLNSKFEIRNSKKNKKIKLEIIKKIEITLERETTLKTLFIEKVLPMGNPGIDAIAVTYGPGLEPALWVGINFAKALGLHWGIPAIPVNHMEGHILSALISRKENSKTEARNSKQIRNSKEENSKNFGFRISDFGFPAISLLVSGGHTELVHIKEWRDYEIIGRTRDDAVGEAFDKVARILGLPYPGGPQISALAEKTRNSKFEIRNSDIKLPRPMINSDDFDFSFSGLKTAVLYLTKKLGKLNESTKMEIAKEFEDSVTEVLVAKTRKAIEERGAKSLIVGGGVIANIHIRRSFEEVAREYNIPLLLPETHLSTDNALMIALAGYFILKSGHYMEKMKADGNLSL